MWKLNRPILNQLWFQLFIDFHVPLVFAKIEKLIKSVDDDDKELYILGDLNCNYLLEPTLSTTKRLQEIHELYIS